MTALERKLYHALQQVLAAMATNDRDEIQHARERAEQLLKEVRNGH